MITCVESQVEDVFKPWLADDYNEESDKSMYVDKNVQHKYNNNNIIIIILSNVSLEVQSHSSAKDEEPDHESDKGNISVL